MLMHNAVQQNENGNDYVINRELTMVLLSHRVSWFTFIFFAEQVSKMLLTYFLCQYAACFKKKSIVP